MTIRIISLLNRLPHISFEEFDKHWGQVHGPLIEALPAVKSGLVKYKQFHVSPETNAALAAMGLPVMAHDGVVEWAADKMEDIFELWMCKEMAEVWLFALRCGRRIDDAAQTIMPDEKNFFERSSVQVIAGDWK
ncbi:hypothetical protein B0H17DRAFT_941526 [Mycena rosella]|uniref:EthD domain-containing protein n=1 Tax=Mycena rosella TaxID=1033263 RepID=A0AAD7GAP5_MYCRO|nr:hypothetical protein B0H17DRAFT_941526 [Mycena rosella]